MAKKLTQVEVQQRRAAAQAEFQNTEPEDAAKKAALAAQIERARKRALITNPEAPYDAQTEGFEVGK